MDMFSYQCGAIDCFNEMVRAGLKPMALAHPCETVRQRAQLLPFCREICAKYGNSFYLEDEMLITDLFPVSMNAGKYNILFYRDPDVLHSYLQIKQDKENLKKEKAYHGEARRQIALRLGILLGYPPEGCQRLIQENTQFESG